MVPRLVPSKPGDPQGSAGSESDRLAVMADLLADLPVAEWLDVIADLLAGLPVAEWLDVIAELAPANRATIARMLTGRQCRGG